VTDASTPSDWHFDADAAPGGVHPIIQADRRGSCAYHPHTVARRRLNTVLESRGSVIASTVSELPSFDTGQFESAELLCARGGATLSIRVAEIKPILFRFGRVRWHQFTAVTNCTPEMVRDAYFRLVELQDSPTLASFLAADRANAKAYSSLHHYCIFLDEEGCYEFFAQSVSAL